MFDFEMPFNVELALYLISGAARFGCQMASRSSLKRTISLSPHCPEFMRQCRHFCDVCHGHDAILFAGDAHEGG
jgi:hypothetical protein